MGRTATCQMATACTTRSEEHTSELQSRGHLVCRLLLEKKTGVPKEHDRAHDRAGTSGSRHRHLGQCADRFLCDLRSVLHNLPVSTFFFFNDTAPPKIYFLSLHAALPV